MPAAVAVDSNGDIYIADYGNSRVRKVSRGTITTFAGGGVGGVTLANIEGIAVDSACNLYIADSNRIRRLSSGTIATLAGTGTRGFTGDGGPAIAATLAKPAGIAVDSSGNLFIADDGNNRVRKVSGGTEQHLLRTACTRANGSPRKAAFPWRNTW